MGNIPDISKEQNLYFLRNGRPAEVDISINDLNRELIAAMKLEYGAAFLGRFSRINGADVRLTEYTGQSIDNFSYDFCVPVNDAGLILILESLRMDGKVPDPNRVDNLFRRISALGGHLLL